MSVPETPVPGHRTERLRHALRRTLYLLEAKDVRLLALDPLQDLSRPCTDAIDIPRRDLHLGTPFGDTLRGHSNCGRVSPEGVPKRKGEFARADSYFCSSNSASTTSSFFFSPPGAWPPGAPV